MANGNVNVKLSADTSGVSQGVKKAEDEIKRLGNSIKRMGEIGEKGKGNNDFISRKDLDEYRKLQGEFKKTYDNYINSMISNARKLKQESAKLNQELHRSLTKDAKEGYKNQINDVEDQKRKIEERIASARRYQESQKETTSRVGGMRVTDSGLAPQFMGGTKNLVTAVMVAQIARSVARYTQTGMDSANNDDFSAFSLAIKTGEYGRNFTKARKDLEDTGRGLGYSSEESTSSALGYTSVGGINNTEKTLEDVKSFQEFSRAFGLETGFASSSAGTMKKLGAVNEGEQRKFANLLAESIGRQGMSGREGELIQATNQLAESISTNKLGMSEGQLASIVSLQDMFAKASDQLKGNMGASAIETMNQHIVGGDSRTDLLLGWGTKYMGVQDRWAFEKQKAKGVADPENLKTIISEAQRQFGNNPEYMKMVLSSVLGLNPEQLEALMNNKSVWDSLSSGSYGKEDIESLLDGSGVDTIKNRNKDFTGSKVGTQKEYEATKDRDRKAWGDIWNTITKPYKEYRNSIGPVGGVTTDAVVGAGGAYAGWKGLNWGMSRLGESFFGASKAGEAFGGLSSVTKGLGKVGKVAGKWAAPLAVGSTALDIAVSDNKALSASEGLTGLAGMWAGAKLGAGAGGAVGSLFGGVGAAPGALVGSLVGGIGGLMGGKWLGGKAYDAVTDVTSKDILDQKDDTRAKEDNTKAIRDNTEALSRKSGKSSFWGMGHATGLDYVPYDGYKAELHKGETVLTSHEARDWRSGKSFAGSRTTQGYQPTGNNAYLTKYSDLLNKEEHVLKTRETLLYKDSDNIDKQHKLKNQSIMFKDLEGKENSETTTSKWMDIINSFTGIGKMTSNFGFGLMSKSGGYSDGGTSGNSGGYSGTSSGKGNKNNVTVNSGISADSLDAKLGGKLSGTGDLFVKAGSKYGIDPAFLAAVAMHETGNGTSKAIKEKNNVGGMMGKNGLRTFDSVPDGIDAMASNLKRLYIDQGLVSLADIQKKYAPVGATNDPTGLNNHWQNGVSKHMDSVLSGYKPLNSEVANQTSSSTKHEVSVVVKGSVDGMTPENQKKVADSITKAFDPSNYNLMNMLENSSVRGAK